MTIISDAFLKLQTAKCMVRQMSKKSYFRRPFDKKHNKWSQTLMKSVRQQITVKEIVSEKAPLSDM